MLRSCSGLWSSGLVSLLKFLDLGKTLGIPTVGSYVTDLPILFSKINRKSIATFFSFVQDEGRQGVFEIERISTFFLSLGSLQRNYPSLCPKSCNRNRETSQVFHETYAITDLIVTSKASEIDSRLKKLPCANIFGDAS